MNECKIITSKTRTPQTLIEAFRDIPVANIDDCMNRLGAVDHAIRPIGHKGQMLGQALTLQVAPGDNLMLHVAMDMIKPGDVLVIDAGGFDNRAIFGELMATYCASKGAVGIVCDGAIRDYNELAELPNIAIYARSATPNGPYKNGPGQIGVPICVGGKTVHPGDIVVGDGDGIIIITPSEAENLSNAARQVVKKEKGIRENIIKNGTYDCPWVKDKLKEIGCIYR